MIELNPLTIQHHYPQVIEEYSSDRKLAIFVLENSAPATIRAWTHEVKETLEKWPSGYPCLLIHDFHKIGRFVLNADMWNSFHELHRLRPDLERYVALIMPFNSDLQPIRLAIRTRDLGVPSYYPIHWEVFGHRKAALSWLIDKECLVK